MMYKLIRHIYIMRDLAQLGQFPSTQLPVQLLWATRPVSGIPTKTVDRIARHLQAARAHSRHTTSPSIYSELMRITEIASAGQATLGRRSPPGTERSLRRYSLGYSADAELRAESAAESPDLQ